MVPSPSLRTIVRTDGICSRFHQTKFSHISDKALHVYKIVNITLQRHPFCTSSSQLLVQVACGIKATRSTFSSFVSLSHFHVTWIHLSCPSFHHITVFLNSSQHYCFTYTGRDSSPLKDCGKTTYELNRSSDDLWCCPILHIKWLSELNFSFINTFLSVVLI